MANTMEVAMNNLLSAIFVEVLPVSLQREMEGKGYSVKICDKYVRLVTVQETITISRNGEVYDDAEKYLRDVDPALFKDFELSIGIPVTREFRYDYSVNGDYWCDGEWLNAYVEYRVPLRAKDISGVIKAAKEFAGLE